MSAELAGPLTRVRFADGSEIAADLPRNTCDPRYTACPSHHLACDCREAMLGEDIAEHRAMFAEVKNALIAATKGHATWAYDPATGDDDPMNECKCPGCVVRRAVSIGFTEWYRDRRATDEAILRRSEELAARARAQRAEHDLLVFAPVHPDADTDEDIEVPF